MSIKRGDLKPVLLIRDTQIEIINKYRAAVKELDDLQKEVGNDMDVIRFGFRCGQLDATKQMIMTYFGVNPDDDFEEDPKGYND